MPRLQELCADLAERFVFEPTKVAGYARVLREAGLLSTGARGKNAPDATPLDAARLVIVMMLRVKQHEAAEAVRLFGQLCPTDDGEVELAGKSATTFEESLSLLITYCGQPFDGSDTARSQLTSFHFFAAIERRFCTGEITIGKFGEEGDEDDEDGFTQRRDFRFKHPDLRGFNPLAPGADLPDRVKSDIWKYRAGFHEVPLLDKIDIVSLGQVIAGHRPIGWTCPYNGWFGEEGDGEKIPE